MHDFFNSVFTTRQEYLQDMDAPGQLLKETVTFVGEVIYWHSVYTKSEVELHCYILLPFNQEFHSGCCSNLAHFILWVGTWWGSRIFDKIPFHQKTLLYRSRLCGWGLFYVWWINTFKHTYPLVCMITLQHMHGLNYVCLKYLGTNVHDISVQIIGVL